ncbi:MAG: NAD(P)/FAD-dependent oxidoreductase [Acidimicrobiia bacterium]|nr:NAD(P)/FAD-dependent oxidoreductase [Acidimicrobiia bacterium]
METRTYDAVIVGAGHNGLVLACYLARAGLSTVVVERRHEEGGGANTEEPVLPGFRHNMHANYMAFIDLMPVIADFGLEDLGLRTVMPEAQHGIAFADGRPPIILHRPDLLERTHASIARYSRSDADLYVELKRRSQRMEQLFAVGFFNPPDPAFVEGQSGALEGLYGDLGITNDFAAKTAKVVIDELFESPEMRTLLYQDAVEFGLPVDTSGLGFGFLTFMMWTTGNWKLPVGGTHTIAKVLTQACYREGVELLENTAVERIVLEDDRAVGVVARGCELRAERLVASNADVKQTLLDLVGEEHLSPAWARRANAFRYGPSHTVASPMFCLYDAPAYRSARWDPEIDRCYHTVVGFDGPDDTIRNIRDAYTGRLPEPGGGTWVNSLWDRSQAPPGRHAAGAWYFFPSASYLSAPEWAEVRETYNEKFLAKWIAVIVIAFNMSKTGAQFSTDIYPIDITI